MTAINNNWNYFNEIWKNREKYSIGSCNKSWEQVCFCMITFFFLVDKTYQAVCPKWQCNKNIKISMAAGMMRGRTVYNVQGWYWGAFCQLQFPSRSPSAASERTARSSLCPQQPRGSSCSSSVPGAAWALLLMSGTVLVLQPAHWA